MAHISAELSFRILSHWINVCINANDLNFSQRITSKICRKTWAFSHNVLELTYDFLIDPWEMQIRLALWNIREKETFLNFWYFNGFILITIQFVMTNAINFINSDEHDHQTAKMFLRFIYLNNKSSSLWTSNYEYSSNIMQ